MPDQPKSSQPGLTDYLKLLIGMGMPGGPTVGGPGPAFGPFNIEQLLRLAAMRMMGPGIFNPTGPSQGLGKAPFNVNQSRQLEQLEGQ